MGQVLEKASDEEKETKDFESPIYKAKKEIDELQGILPEIRAKIEDTEDEKKNMDDLKNLAKEALVGLCLIIVLKTCFKNPASSDICVNLKKIKILNF